MDFSELAAVFRKMESTTKRLELTDDLAKLFAQATTAELPKIIYLSQGSLLPSHKGVDLGVADKMAIRAISLVTAKKLQDIEAHYRKSGDLGITAEELLQRKAQTMLSQQQALTVKRVYDNFYKMATASGSGSQELKIKLLAELLAHATAQEARVLVRFVTGTLRLGVGDATLIDALSVWKAGDKSLREELERAFNLRSDLGLVAELFAREGLEAVRKIGPEPFAPIRPALAERLSTPQEIMERLGPCLLEAKYDGLRIQVHKKGKQVELYSRRQERVTAMFPDLVTAAQTQLAKVREIIFEGEAVGYQEETGDFLPFQRTMQRKRKHEIAKKAEEIPLRLFAFELLYLDGKDYTQQSYRVRREQLENAIGKGDTIVLSKAIHVKKPEQLQKFFEECIERGLEGIMAKDLNAPYTAGARKFAWVKLKRSYGSELTDTLDLVVVGYYVGKGKRTQFGFGGMLTAAYDDQTDSFKTIAKVGSGFTEEQMTQLRELFEKISRKTKPPNVAALIEPHVWVEPKYVVVVKADEITQSPTHTCGMKKTQTGWSGEGLALRFPRMIELRTDKSPRQATTESEVLGLFKQQRQRGIAQALEQ